MFKLIKPVFSVCLLSALFAGVLAEVTDCPVTYTVTTSYTGLIEAPGTTYPYTTTVTLTEVSYPLTTQTSTEAWTYEGTTSTYTYTTTYTDWWGPFPTNCD
ncbi:hypothetical protein HYDPIDRAFT_40872 [Hydnomerulius pinastri MD-312]|uniref:Uncharacterized protein n=1 Tax=Hydnomerulius pinastri MD-312 TaxID=994086 RepID=A0A0C9W8K6_9AGAM|nr:hypothetical protein HYDPIDRAFT_40872 [Hydnomerulius pinastri MD-312]